ncbi:pyridoxal phosphate-dependent transferase [Xylogone sp. PMI_703]|nr:pyridoxal phosphate-dependent transferase [Xylogone sp. PMI_703]
MASIEELYTTLISNYVSRNVKSKAIFEEASKVLPGGNTRTVLYSEPFALVFASGKDATITSVDGDEYLDLVSEYSAGIYGKSCEPIIEAIKSVLDKGLNFGGNNQYEAILAKAICSRFKCLDMVRFCNSGTEANLMGAALAIAHTGRRKVVVFENGYHGSGFSFKGAPSPMNLPHDFIVAEYNSIPSVKDIVSKNADSIAAILVEPVQGSGGAIPATKEFLQYLRDAASEIGALLIFDEVMTSRLAYGGMQGVHEIYPDLMTAGKYLGGGNSFGCFGGKAEIMQRFDPSREDALTHSGTFNNNIVTMVAGITGSKLLTPAVFKDMNDRGDRLRVKIGEVLAKNSVKNMNVTGVGSLIGIHFAGKQAAALGGLLFFYMLENNIYMGRRGFLCLNIKHTDEHVERAVKAIEGFVKLYGNLLV